MVLLGCSASLNLPVTLLQANPASSGSADWRELPPDLLHRILAVLFHPRDCPAPLLDLFQQHASLQLTCKAWAAALEQSTYEVRAAGSAVGCAG